MLSDGKLPTQENFERLTKGAQEADSLANVARKNPKYKAKLKAGGKVTKKGGMAAFERSAFDKKADGKGKRHGVEGSAKDKRMDKKDAKKLGYIKRNGGKG